MNAIEVRDLKKSYRIRGVAPPTLFGHLRRLVTRRRPDVFHALKGVSFDVPAGKTVGIIGPNGSGKSSTLGLVAGTITPSSGTVRTSGRISSLLELGAGFHPDLTGIENIYLNAAILGIPRARVRQKLERIIDFSGLHDFVQQPVKTYSSGMYVRLGFAVAVEMDPDILLIDEVLAVGDIAFQLKCLDRIREFQRQGKTLLFVSHALQTVEEFCDEVLLIHEGNLVARGDPTDVIMEYIKSYMGEGGQLFTQEFGTRRVEILDVRLRDKEGREAAIFNAGEVLEIEIRYHAKERIEKPIFGYSLKTGNGYYLYGSNTCIMNYPIDAIEGEGVMRLRFDPLKLLHGNFFLSLSIHSWDHAEQFHRREDWYPFSVKNPSEAQGVFALDSSWTLD